MGSHFECAFTIALEAGLRRGEIVGLKWSNIDFANDMICIRQALVDTKISGQSAIIEQPPKTTAGRRDIPMTDKCKKALKAHRQKQRLQRLKSRIPL